MNFLQNQLLRLSTVIFSVSWVNVQLCVLASVSANLHPSRRVPRRQVVVGHELGETPPTLSERSVEKAPAFSESISEALVW